MNGHEKVVDDDWVPGTTALPLLDPAPIPHPDDVAGLRGRTLVAALRERGSRVREVAMPPCGHWDTVRSLGTERSETFDAAAALMGLPA